MQKHLSGFSSPAVSSPSCEIKNELTFPPLSNNQSQPQQQPQQQQPQSFTEATKVTPKISQLSELEEQLSKIHQKPFTQQQQQQQQSQTHVPTYSEAVRQSPTTVQQPFPQQQQNNAIAPQQIQPPVVINSVASPIVNAATQPPSAQKIISRFSVSKVEEQKQVTPSPLQSQVPNVSKPLLSPEVEVINVQQQQLIQNTPIQMQSSVVVPTQAQAFFQQHQGGVVSKKRIFFLKFLFLFSSFYCLILCCAACLCLFRLFLMFFIPMENYNFYLKKCF